ncbi:MAG: hypothetical protein N3A71_01765 [Candidatus Dojkabacteria bacterium]|nr:hypothetical protein [Candidatus Dojkabacteria bacterium]
MNNFTFSRELELSVVIHRFKKLLKIYEEISEDISTTRFYPAIIYNEDFWRSPFEKQKVILIQNMNNWLGTDPSRFSNFYIDDMYIDVLYSLKLSMFSYSKISFDALLNVLTIKTKFSITEFTDLSEPDNAKTFINNLISRVQKKDEDTNYHSDIFYKILSEKIYNINKSNINILLVFKAWNTTGLFKILENIKNISTEIGSKTLQIDIVLFKFKFYSTKKEVISNIKSYESNNVKINLETVYILDYSVNTTRRYDLIYYEYLFGFLPSDVVLKYSNIYYSKKTRLSYLKKTPLSESLKEIAKIQNPLNPKVEKDKFKYIAKESIWTPYQNKIISELIDTLTPVEGDIYQVSTTLLAIFIKTIECLEKNGIFIISDYIGIPNSYIDNLNIVDDVGYQVSVVDIQAINEIVKKNDEYTKYESLELTEQKFISYHIFSGNKKNNVIIFGDLYQYISNDILFSKHFFNIKNFQFYDELKKELSKIKNMQKIALKGWPIISKFIYESILIKKYREILEKLSKKYHIFKDVKVDIDRISRLKDIISFNLYTKFKETLKDKKNQVITMPSNENISKEWDNLLKEYYFNPDKIYKLLKKHAKIINTYSSKPKKVIIKKL